MSWLSGGLSSVVEMSRFAIASILCLQLIIVGICLDESFAASGDKAQTAKADPAVKANPAAKSPASATKLGAAAAGKPGAAASAAAAAGKPGAAATAATAATNLMGIIYLAKPTAAAGGLAQTLIFPSDRSVGRLCKVARISRYYGLSVDKPHFAIARGVIKIPADAKVRLELDYNGAEDPTPLLKVHSKALVSLDARDIDNFDDKTLQVISQLKNLWELRLDTTDITDRGMASLKNMSDVVDLNIARTLISPAGLEALKGMTSLERLGVGFNKLNDDSIANVEGLKLVALSIAASGISDKALEHVAKIKSMRFLDLFDNKKITNKGMAYLIDLPVLDSLTLNGTSVDMRALESFKKLKNLRHLVLEPKYFQPSDIVTLRAALPLCVVERFVPRGNVSPEVLAPLH
jgi:hypothetical protein